MRGAEAGEWYWGGLHKGMGCARELMISKAPSWLVSVRTMTGSPSSPHLETLYLGEPVLAVGFLHGADGPSCRAGSERVV